MPNNVSIPVDLLFGFLLVLSRVAGAFIFFPLPGFKDAPEPARVVFALAMTLALLPFWPSVAETPQMGTLLIWMASEVAFGLTVGLIVSLVTEGMVVAAQAIGLQAGYSYASTIDPSGQNDTTVLQMMAQLVSGLLFFALGFHRTMIGVFAASLKAHPPGTFHLTAPLAETVIKLCGTIFTTGLRLGLPVVALLLIIDLSLALIGRINAQLQLISLAFPLKMLASLFALGSLAVMFPGAYEKAAAQLFRTLAGLVN